MGGGGLSHPGITKPVRKSCSGYQILGARVPDTRSTSGLLSLYETQYCVLVRVLDDDLGDPG